MWCTHRNKCRRIIVSVENIKLSIYETQKSAISLFAHLSPFIPFINPKKLSEQVHISHLTTVSKIFLIENLAIFLSLSSHLSVT